MKNKEKVREVLDGLYEYAWAVGNSSPHGTARSDYLIEKDAHIADALESLLEQEQEQEQDGARWVSVEERLPELNQEVLAYTHDEGEGYFVVDRFQTFGPDGLAENRFFDTNITHWYPITALPETEGGE